mgnify:CR=1 FL=1
MECARGAAAKSANNPIITNAGVSRFIGIASCGLGILFNQKLGNVAVMNFWIASCTAADSGVDAS